jgi:hypothetical protein
MIDNQEENGPSDEFDNRIQTVADDVGVPFEWILDEFQVYEMYMPRYKAETRIRGKYDNLFKRPIQFESIIEPNTLEDGEAVAVRTSPKHGIKETVVVGRLSLLKDDTSGGVARIETPRAWQWHQDTPSTVEEYEMVNEREPLEFVRYRRATKHPLPTLRRADKFLELIEYSPVLNNGKIESYQPFSRGWVMDFKLGQMVEPMVLLPEDALDMLR